jgi:hypothetical protein
MINARMYGNVQTPLIEAVSKGPSIAGNALRVDLEIAS